MISRAFIQQCKPSTENKTTKDQSRETNSKSIESFFYGFLCFAFVVLFLFLFCFVLFLFARLSYMWD